MALILPNTLVAHQLEKTVPDAFWGDITQAILLGYELSATDPRIPSKVYEKRHRAATRNFCIDAQMESVARKHFDVEGGFRDNCTGSHMYTELIVQDEIILTASSVNSPKQLPRASMFRLEAAMHNPEIRQLDIFASNVIHADFSNKTVEKRKLYGVILHGPAKSITPEFIIVAIPDFNYQFHLATIDLLGKYSSFSTVRTDIDLSVQDIEKPSAQLRIRPEKYIEDDDRVAGDIFSWFEDDGGEGA